jgi:hypothetical protein
MSALAMLLTAAMVTPVDVSEKVSGEVKLTDSLDLSGEWQGVWKAADKAEYEVHQLEGRGAWSYRRLPKGQQGPAYLSPGITDEGEGRLRLTWVDDPCLGIYEQDGDCLIICFREARKGRPLSFRSGDGQHFLILHRVKPGK